MAQPSCSIAPPVDPRTSTLKPRPEMWVSWDSLRQREPGWKFWGTDFSTRTPVTSGAALHFERTGTHYLAITTTGAVGAPFPLTASFRSVTPAELTVGTPLAGTFDAGDAWYRVSPPGTRLVVDRHRGSSDGVGCGRAGLRWQSLRRAFVGGATSRRPDPDSTDRLWRRVVGFGCRPPGLRHLAALFPRRWRHCHSSIWVSSRSAWPRKPPGQRFRRLRSRFG